MNKKILIIAVFIIVVLVAFLIFLVAKNDIFATKVALVNGEAITLNELEKAYTPIKERYIKEFKGEELDKKLKEGRTEALDQLIEWKLIIQYAKNKGYTITETEVDNIIEDMKKDAGSPEKFESGLKEKDLNFKVFRQKIKEGRIIANVVEHEVTQKIQLSDDDIEMVYSAQKETYLVPEQVRVRNILIKAANGAATEVKTVAKKKADEILLRLKSGEDFEGLAQQYSEDASTATKGGDMGYIGKKLTPSYIGKVVFNLKKGEISGVVETPNGYEIYKVEEFKDAYYKSLDEVKPQISEQLRNQKMNSEIKKWVKEIRDRSDIKLY